MKLFQVFGLLAFTLLNRQAVGDDWPQWRGPQRDGVWREAGIVSKLPSKLTYKWRTPIGGGYAGPAIVAGHVYVTDFVRADDSTDEKGSVDRERVLCLDADTGKEVWKYIYDCKYEFDYTAGPRATPTVHDGKVYSVGAMGDFFCLDASTGEVLWQFDYIKDYGTKMNAWGMSAAPLIDGAQVILLVGGANDSCVVAFEKDTGKERWRALEGQDPGYSAPVIIEAGGQRQLIVWTPSSLTSLDPATGRVFWEDEISVGTNMSIATPVHDPKAQLLFVSSFFTGPAMMQLDADGPDAKLLWKGHSSSEIKTDGLHSLMCTAVIDGDHLYGVGSYGELRCIEKKTGKRVWETLKATGKGRWWNAFLVSHEDRYFICNEQGELIIARLSPSGYEEVSRAFLIEPTQKIQRRPIVWSHPGFAGRRIYARNDKEIVCVDLAAR